MGYAILRVQKLKAAVAVHRSAKHNYREQDTPNADPGRTPDNTHLGPQNVAELMAAFNARLPAKFRKDAVQCVEVLVTGSPETMAGKDREGQDAYLHDSLAWIRERFGQDNVVGASIHRDESTPHLVAYVVPVDPESGRLNAKKWLGGSRALSELQTGFWEGVGRKHGLDRGQERSRATHKTIRQHYAEIQAAERLADRHGVITPAEVEPQPIKPSTVGDKLSGLMLGPKLEPPEAIAARLTQRVRPIILEADQVHRENKRLKAELAQHRKAGDRLRAEVAALREQVESFAKAFRDLTRDQLAKLVKLADQFRQDNAKDKLAEQEAARKLAEFDRQRPPRSPGMGR